MTDFPQDFQPLDPGRIQADDPVEIAYWCRTLGCTEPQLEQAVRRVGPHVAQVRQVLADAATAAAPTPPGRAR